MSERELARLAIRARNFSYSPYSGCKVGAALLSYSGKVFKGCNIENSSFSATVCAERTAFFKALSEGEKEFKMIAVAGGRSDNIEGEFPPCGVCRQVMAEFCSPEFVIILATGKDSYKKYFLSELLPQAFSPGYLK